MPILTGSQETSDGHRIIRLPGLPDFNSTDFHFVVEELDGWDDGPSPVPVLVDNGGGPGMVAVDPWTETASYYQLVGSIEAPPSDHQNLRRLLLASLTPNAETPLIVVDETGDSLQAFVRVYDRRTVELLGRTLRFTLPLVAPDPFKYGLTPLTATAGGFVPSDWFRVYTEDAGDWYRSYFPDGSVQYRSYDEDEQAEGLPQVASLTSAGDAESSRMTITVTGPATSGEWWVEDAAGKRLWAEVTLAAGQSVVFDCRKRTAHLLGADITHTVFGDFPRLVPGANTYRLIVGSSGVGSFMDIEALEASQ